MKKFSAVALALVFGGVACNEIPTSPAGIAAPQTASNYSSFRPPPPLDGYVDVTSTAFEFSFYATYFMNGPENNGWISFSSTQPTGVSLSSPSARITIHNGTISGAGTLSFQSAGETFVIDLSSGLSKGNFSTACSGGVIDVTLDTRGGGSCATFEVTATSGQRSIQAFATFFPSLRVITSGQ
jgi:hypothetical protein